MDSLATRRIKGCAAVGIGMLLVVFACLAVLAFIQGEVPPEVERGEMLINGVERNYIYYVPDSYDSNTLTPLIISIHGLASWPENQLEISQWNEVADEEGLIVAFPSGLGRIRSWRAGGSSDTEGMLEEVRFIEALIDRMERDFNIDPARIYVNGLSNGGGMAYMLACSLSDRVAAVASVSGAYLYDPQECRPERPVPLMAFHGTEDWIVPFEGGSTTFFRHEFPSVTAWIAAWAGRNGCEPEPESVPVSEEVSSVHYTGCDQGAEVIFYTIKGGGHTWPGGGALPSFIGYRTDDIDATAVMWAFFQRHALEQDTP